MLNHPLSDPNIISDRILLVFYAANSNYELGRDDKIGGWKPQPVPSLKDVRIIQIACGGYHSLALTGK